MLSWKNGTTDLWATLPPEAQVIASCARVRLNAAAQERLDSLLAQDLDWECVQRHVGEHGIEALVHRHLSRYPEAVPSDVQDYLAQRAQQVAFRNLQHTQELLHLVQQLEEKKIPVIPFKGPMLAALAYGDVSFRRFIDLDVMVQRDDIPLVKEVLVEHGYEPARNLDEKGEAEYIDSQLGYEFVHLGKRNVIEVHWTFFYEIYAFDLTPDEVWGRHETTTLCEVAVRTLAPEDLFIYLCAHGTKHRWMKLKWIADVAEFVRSYPKLDWSALQQRAERLGCQRMLRLGCYLAHELLDAPIPASVLQAARGSQVVRSMGRQVCTDWLFREPEAPNSSELEVFRFHLKERERWRDRWPYVKHHLDLWLGLAA